VLCWLALVSGVGLGFANPTLGCLADKYSFTKISTCGIFIISGDSISCGISVQLLCSSSFSMLKGDGSNHFVSVE